MTVSLPVLSAAPPRAARLSLTDRCDLACVYCRPHRHDGYASERLDLDAWVTMVEGLVAAGVRRVRLTGGEPLLHKGVVDAVRRLSRLPLDDLALTTNATRLAGLARPLRAAGLRRLNVSLDSLDPATFARLTRGGRLADVLAGLDAACEAGFDEIKLNTVVLRGENDHELEAIVEFAWARAMTPRFLELMSIGEGAAIADKLVPAREMRARLTGVLAEGDPRPEPSRGPARYVLSRRDPARRVGFITGATDTFCEGCDRVRVSSAGEMRPCLATPEGAVSAAGAARGGDAQGVHAALDEAWSRKPDGAQWKGCTEEAAARVSMRAIGG